MIGGNLPGMQLGMSLNHSVCLVIRLFTQLLWFVLLLLKELLSC